MKERLLVGLDIGTSHIRMAMAQLTPQADKRVVLQFIGAVEVPALGIAKGNVTSLEEAVSSISQALEQAERMVGIQISEAIVGIGGIGISTHISKGVIGVSRPEGDIRADDVARALEAARSLVNPANQEMIHVLPRQFSVDGQRGIKDPIGMQGIRLEAEVQMILGMSSHVRNLTKTVYRTGIDISELVYTPLALAEAVTSSRERELGVGALGIGATTSVLAVYEGGELLHAATLPLGADHITSDIAIGLRISLDAAEQIKRMHGTTLPQSFGRKGEEIDLKDYGGEQAEMVPLRFVAEIIEARVEEIYERAEEELKKIERSGLLPAGMILSGGGAKLPGMVEVGKRMLRLPCAIGRTSVQTTVPEYIEDPTFSTATGLVLWAYDRERHEGGEEMLFRPRMGGGMGKGLFGKVTQPLSKIFKSFMP